MFEHFAKRLILTVPIGSLSAPIGSIGSYRLEVPYRPLSAL